MRIVRATTSWLSTRILPAIAVQRIMLWARTAHLQPGAVGVEVAGRDLLTCRRVRSALAPIFGDQLPLVIALDNGLSRAAEPAQSGAVDRAWPACDAVLPRRPPCDALPGRRMDQPSMTERHRKGLSRDVAAVENVWHGQR